MIMDMEASDNPPVDAVAAEEKFKSLSASGRGKLGACTRKMNEIKTLLVPGGNVETVNEGVATFKMCLKEFEEMHANVKTLLSDEIMEHERINCMSQKCPHSRVS